MTKKWRRTAPPGARSVLRSESRNGKSGRINVHSSSEIGDSYRERLNRPAFRAMQYVIDLVAVAFLRELAGYSLRCGEWAIRVCIRGGLDRDGEVSCPFGCAMVSPGNAQNFA